MDERANRYSILETTCIIGRMTTIHKPVNIPFQIMRQDMRKYVSALYPIENSLDLLIDEEVLNIYLFSSLE